MGNELKGVSNEKDISTKGIYISAAVIFAGIFPNIHISGIEFSFPSDSWLLLLFGFSSLFYFLSINFNQVYKINESGHIFRHIPLFKSPLSQECLFVAIILFILFLSRGGFLLWSN